MALTYGFYNSIEGDRVYDAIQFGSIFDGIIKDGVYATYLKGMMVMASENAGEVIIQPGRAWFNHTWSYNDANLIMTAPAPEVLLERIDALVLEVNEELSARENSYKWISGTPSSRPERPTLTNTSTIHQYPLCYVHRYPETTMIYAKDITNMVGTSECPFATGVLEGINLDAWIRQWDDEFHSWENTTQTGFEAWMLSQEESYSTWVTAIKAQMDDDVADVEAWIETIQNIIDSETATHLQNEIDELRAEIAAGSHITVSTTETDLYGQNVTITESGGTVFTERFDNNGIAEFKSVPYVGNLTIHSSYGTDVAESVVFTPYYSRYLFSIAFWAATVNIVGDEDFAGETVTVKDSHNVTVGAIVLDGSAEGTFTAVRPDTYTFSLTYGGETMEETLSVLEETTYTVELHARSFNWEDWLEAGGVTGTYSTLADVLADEVALRRLFTVHASVDYMAGIVEDIEDVETIINNDLAAKWINLRDYALDTLYTNTYVKDYMDDADKYFYGELSIMPQVPSMTSNTTPYGIASASSETSGHEAYQALTGLEPYSSHSWCSASGTSNQWMQYEFPKTICIKRFRFLNLTDGSYSRDTDLVFQASNDGITFIDLKSIILSPGETHYVDVNNSNKYKYYRLKINGQNNTYSGGSCRAYNLQLYAYSPKGNVPKMTSNTAPYGEASASSVYQQSYAYKAFDGDSSTVWGASSTAYPQTLQYRFTNPICVKRFHMEINGTDRIATYKIRASNDNSTWIDLTNAITATYSADGEWVEIENNNYYLYYQLYCITGNLTAIIKTAQFYGRSLNVSVPKMTNYTAPYGEASASQEVTTADSSHSIGNAWRGFDGSTSDGWGTVNTLAGSWLMYDFKKPIKISMAQASSVASVAIKYRFEGSKDGNEWFQLTNEITGRVSDNAYIMSKFTQNVDNYRYYRFYCTGGGNQWLGRINVNFFGLDYTEREFATGSTMKYLYDHGLEFETATAYTSSASCSAVKNEDDLEFSVNAVQNNMAGFTFPQINLDSYSLLRAKVGDSLTVWESVGARSSVLDNSQTSNVSELGMEPSNSNLPDAYGLDISSLDSSYYIACFCANTSSQSVRKGTLKELWLE